MAAAAIAAAGLGDEQEFAIFARGDDGRVVAGISAIVWGGYCELQAMWVEESLRSRGLAFAPSSARRTRPAGEAARSSCCTRMTCSLAASTSALDTKPSV